MKNLSKLIGSCLLLAAGSIQGSTIFWGTPQNSDLLDPAFAHLHLVNSQGVLLDGSYSFELGTFAPGFTPDATNLDHFRQSCSRKRLESRKPGGCRNGRSHPDLGLQFSLCHPGRGLPARRTRLPLGLQYKEHDRVSGMGIAAGCR